MRRSPFALPDLRLGLVGGAVASSELCRAFRDSFGTPLVDAYGSTETCGAITMNPPDGVRVDGSSGLPVPGVQVRIVDPGTGLDVPTGREGEVWVSGPNVMIGYHDKPEATAAALRDGWYRTGDLARCDDLGYFTVCGRITDLIIRGGENVHPDEIEAVLRGVAGVADVAVAGRPHDALGEVPVGYVVPDSAGMEIQALIEWCRDQLSPYKVPEEIYEVATIPRTPSGKIMRSAGRAARCPAVRGERAPRRKRGRHRCPARSAITSGRAGPAFPAGRPGPRAGRGRAAAPRSGGRPRRPRLP
jgi:acyl-CoA synthetase (AMP-forming)/AMP-acid ligase II